MRLVRSERLARWIFLLIVCVAVPFAITARAQQRNAGGTHVASGKPVGKPKTRPDLARFAAMTASFGASTNERPDRRSGRGVRSPALVYGN